MEIGARLRKRWYLVILAAIIALLVGASSVVKFGHKGLKVNRSVYRVGIGQLLVDTNPSTLTNIVSGSGALGGRAELIAQYSTGPGVVNNIAKLTGVSPNSLTVQAQSASATKTGGSASKSLAHIGKGSESVLLRTAGQSQSITITAQAHTDALAKSLVSATMTSMRRALKRLQNAQPYNHLTSVTTSSTTTTSTTTTPGTGTAKSGKGGKGAKGGGASKSSANQSAAKAAAKAKQLQSQKARQIQQSKLVLRPLGAIRVTKVVVSPSKGKAIGYAVGAFIVLLLLILGLDAMLRGSGAGRPKPLAPTPGTPIQDGPAQRTIEQPRLPAPDPSDEAETPEASQAPAPEPSARD
jgi:hypothetical protein